MSTRQAKMGIKFGTFSKWFIVIIYSVLLFHLLSKLKSQDVAGYDAMTWGIYMALLGVFIGGVLAGIGNVESVTGREDVLEGLQFSLPILAVMFLVNYFFIATRGAYSLLGDVTLFSQGERLFLSLAAALNEELFFRFALQRMFQAGVPDNPMGWTISVGAPALMFSAYHYYVYGNQGMETFVYLFLLGFAAGLGQALTKRFSVPLLVHIENNFLALVFGG